MFNSIVRLVSRVCLNPGFKHIIESFKMMKFDILHKNPKKGLKICVIANSIGLLASSKLHPRKIERLLR